MTDEPMITGTMEQVLQCLFDKNAHDEADGMTYAQIRTCVPDLLSPTLQEMKRHRLLHNAPYGNKSRWWLAPAGFDWLIAQAKDREASEEQTEPTEVTDKYADACCVDQDECGHDDDGDEFVPTTEHKLNVANRTICELMEHQRNLLEQIQALRDDNAALTEMLDIERERGLDGAGQITVSRYLRVTNDGEFYPAQKDDAMQQAMRAAEETGQAQHLYGMVLIGTAKPVISSVWEFDSSVREDEAA